jgi:hypothetical protein
MTQPQAQGFPDFQRQTPAQSTIFLQFNQAINAPLNQGPFFCGYQTSTRVALEATNKNVSILLFWFADKALSQPLGQQEIVVQTNAEIDTAVSNMGPWVLVEITAQSYPATLTFQLSAVAYSGNALNLAHANIVIGSENAAIGIGGTLSIFSTLVWPGPAQLHLRMNQQPYTLSLAGIDINGNRVPFYQHVGTAIESFTNSLFLPASIVRAIVTNSSGIAATCSIYVVGDVSTRPGR